MNSLNILFSDILPSWPSLFDKVAMCGLSVDKGSEEKPHLLIPLKKDIDD